MAIESIACEVLCFLACRLHWFRFEGLFDQDGGRFGTRMLVDSGIIAERCIAGVVCGCMVGGNVYAKNGA
jgi:hypothetical protein